MSTMEYTPLVIDLISERLSQTSIRPLFVSISGPQGSGKTTLCTSLQAHFSSSSYSSHSSSVLNPNAKEGKPLKTIVLSIDDFYLPHDGLIDLAKEHKGNRLWQGRGLPGTHDVGLLKDVLGGLRDGKKVRIPRFDKSLFGGEGDRVEGEEENGEGEEVGLVILEGWCVGFRAVPSDDEAFEKLGEYANEMREVNERLEAYHEVWDMFGLTIQLSVEDYSIVYTWRLEQEEWMKKLNGGRGMTDDQVKAFVDRYMPAYALYGKGKGPTDHHAVRLVLDQNRRLIL